MTGERPQTIQFHLPQCELRAIRFADIAMLIVQAVLVPRSKLPDQTVSRRWQFHSDAMDEWVKQGPGQPKDQRTER